MPQPLTKNEQELTRLAAKAAGREPDEVDRWGARFVGEPEPILGGWSRWNPLRDDVDAFGLIAQLRLMVEFADDGYEARADAYTGHHWTALFDGDSRSTLRHAVTCCAALMGGWKP